VRVVVRSTAGFALLDIEAAAVRAFLEQADRSYRRVRRGAMSTWTV
jgi:hypothetical protein